MLAFIVAFLTLISTFLAGLAAVLLALVFNGFVAALLVLGAILLVQQIEGHLLYPLLMGRAVHLHPAVITGHHRRIARRSGRRRDLGDPQLRAPRTATPDTAHRRATCRSPARAQRVSAADRAVRQRTEQGLALYELDEARLAELQPDMIVTQAVCEVCAVSYDDVVVAAARLPGRPQVISLDPSSLDEVLADVPRLATATGAPAAGERLLADAGQRLEAVRVAMEGAERPRVAALEWLDPIYVGGHWVPEMIRLAGGEDVLGEAGGRSRTAEWEEVEAARPEVIVSMPCGYDLEQAVTEAVADLDRLAGRGARVAAVDASSYFSRPGPRLVDGVELLAHMLHPDRVEPPPEGRFAWLTPARRAA